MSKKEDAFLEIERRWRCDSVRLFIIGIYFGRCLFLCPKL
nr:MAG TPA: hypothetical protein [Caudoviricetes sp.]DAT02590.1 MAG TPA: hypothetical protein [Caudoviricetes sp.]